MKDWLKKLLKQKEEARAAMKEKGAKSENIEEVRSIGAQIDTIDKEIAEIRQQLNAMPDDEPEGTPAGGAAPTVVVGEQRGQPVGGSPVGRTQIIASYGVGGGQASGTEDRTAELGKKYEKRGEDLKAKRAVTFDLDELPEFRAVSLAGGTLVLPKHTSGTLNPEFTQVSSLIDTVNAVPLPGGESYEKGFVVGYGEGDYTTETGNYVETDPVFGYVTIGKAKITAYTEMSDEAMKLPNVNYQALVAKNITTAIRKKISRQIIAGAGGSNAIVGIFNAPANVIPTASDIGIAAIDADTLDKIVYSYGGDEDVEGGMYLILSKTDLAEFAAIRDANGRKLYTITLNGNTGTISSDGSYSVNFIINSVCPALSAAATAEDAYCMAYGMLHCYEMPIFSQLTVEESRDFKFRTGQIAYRGSIWVGGNVSMYKGFCPD